jgi:tetratricopeptide (TPR) repeat protein
MPCGNFEMPIPFELAPLEEVVAVGTSSYTIRIGAPFSVVTRRAVAVKSVAEALAGAIQAHQTGQWQQAEALYRQVLQAEPSNADALHLLGVLAYQAGQYQPALAYIGRALAVRPQAATFHSSLGLVLHALHRWDEAVAC